MSNERILELCIAIGVFIILIALNKILAISVVIVISGFFLFKYREYLQWGFLITLFKIFVLSGRKKFTKKPTP